MGVNKYADYISIGIQLLLSVVFIYFAARKLNPLKGRIRLKKIRKEGTKKKVKE